MSNPDKLTDIKKSVSATQLIQQFETKTKPPVGGGKNARITSSPVRFVTDEVPINSELALAKEDLLLNYYFGLPTVSAGDFVNSELDSLLLTQLETETDLSQCQLYVTSYLGNYTNWACLAKMHSHKTQLKWNEHKLQNKHLSFEDPDARLDVEKESFEHPADPTLTKQVIELSAEKQQIDYVRGHLGNVVTINTFSYFL